jgi:hypothetical protein
MKKYQVTLSQSYTQEYSVTIEVESKLSYEELYDNISETTSEWRIARLSEKELISKGLINGYVEGSYSEYDGDSDASSDVTTSLEEK